MSQAKVIKGFDVGEDILAQYDYNSLANIPTISTIETDESLSISGAAADAKVTGDTIKELKYKIDETGTGTVSEKIKQAIDDIPADQKLRIKIGETEITYDGAEEEEVTVEIPTLETLTFRQYTDYDIYEDKTYDGSEDLTISIFSVEEVSGNDVAVATRTAADAGVTKTRINDISDQIAELEGKVGDTAVSDQIQTAIDGIENEKLIIKMGEDDPNPIEYDGSAQKTIIITTPEITTDKTLSRENIPADSKATGDAINKSLDDAKNYTNGRIVAQGSAPTDSESCFLWIDTSEGETQNASLYTRNESSSVNADTLGGISADQYATKEYVALQIAEAQLGGNYQSLESYINSLIDARLNK